LLLGSHENFYAELKRKKWDGMADAVNIENWRAITNKFSVLYALILWGGVMYKHMRQHIGHAFVNTSVTLSWKYRSRSVKYATWILTKLYRPIA
jgi:hypothetical protein